MIINFNTFCTVLFIKVALLKRIKVLLINIICIPPVFATGVSAFFERYLKTVTFRCKGTFTFLP